MLLREGELVLEQAGPCCLLPFPLFLEDGPDFEPLELMVKLSGCSIHLRVITYLPEGLHMLTPLL